MPDAIVIVLPWPARVLSPNNQHSWRTKAKAARVAKDGAFYLTRNTVFGLRLDTPKAVHVTIRFYPPDRKPRDTDNLVAQMKHAQDGVFAALGWNDALSIRTAGEMCEVRQGGQVEYEIRIEKAEAE